MSNPVRWGGKFQWCDEWTRPILRAGVDQGLTAAQEFDDSWAELHQLIYSTSEGIYWTSEGRMYQAIHEYWFGPEPTTGEQLQTMVENYMHEAVYVRPCALSWEPAA